MKKGENHIVDIEQILADYFTGCITEENLLKLDDWIKSSDENRAHFNSLKDAWIVSGTTTEISASNPDESWNTVKSKLTITGSDENPQLNRTIYLRKYLYKAASWLLIFGLGAAVTWFISGRVKPSSVVSDRLVEISVPLGARSKILMPDSTEIWLNAGTFITYNQDYGQNNRTINLTGEAYFNVARDKRHPFIVKTQSVTVTALGTRFNVKAYPDEKTISATLEEGKIDVRVTNEIGSNERILLLPNDKFIYHKQTQLTEKYTESAEDKIISEGRRPIKHKNINVLSNVRTELYTSWKDSRWIIDRERLNTLAPLLERRFNLKFIFDDEQLKKYNFTGTIENETVDQILNALKLTAPLNYEMRRDTIFLFFDHRSNEEYNRIMNSN